MAIPHEKADDKINLRTVTNDITNINIDYLFSFTLDLNFTTLKSK